MFRDDRVTLAFVAALRWRSRDGRADITDAGVGPQAWLLPTIDEVVEVTQRSWPVHGPLTREIAATASGSEHAFDARARRWYRDPVEQSDRAYVNRRRWEVKQSHGRRK